MSFQLPPALASALEEQGRELQAELRSSPRLRVGLAAILAILVIYGLLQWNEIVAARRQELDKLNHAITRLRATEGEGPLWDRRTHEAAEVLKAYESRVWTAPSFGRAQAGFQDWVSNRLGSLHAQRVQVALINDATTGARFGEGDPVPMKLNVSFDFSSIQLENFLAGIYMSGRNIRIDSLMASKTRRKIEMVLVAWAAPGEDTKPPEAEQSAPAANVLDMLQGLPR